MNGTNQRPDGLANLGREDISRLEISTPGQFEMFSPMTSPDTINVISLPELAAGRSRSDGQVLRTCLVSGPAHLPVSHSLLPERASLNQMNDTSRLSGSISSVSAALQCSLANRLQTRLKKGGSTIYSMRWSGKATPAGRQYCQLVASARRTSASGCSSEQYALPTPSGTSNGGRNHVAGRLDEWGGSTNPFRGTPLGKLHCPSFELWMMGFPGVWWELMPHEMPSSRKSRRYSSKILSAHT